MDRNQLLNDNEASIITALDGRQSRMWTALPGIVNSVDVTSMTVSVQPAIQGIVTSPNGSTAYVNLPLLVDVPICFPGAGGFIITFPIKAGDEVLVVFSSRCMDSWWQSGGVGVPMEVRMHDLSDGFAIPGPKSLPNVVSGISSSNLQIRTDNGSAYLELTPSGTINLVAPSGVSITGDLVVSGEVTGNGIPLSTHLHPGVQSGGSDTGAPIP